MYGVAGLAIGGPAEALHPLSPIVDAHIHLFDTSRVGGVPWPYKSDSVLYKPAMPERYKTVTAGLDVVAAIAIEASPLASDNDWLLGVAQANPIIVGIVGDLIPGDAAYQASLARLHANPLFLGIRYGNLWDRNLSVDIGKPGFIDGLKLLSQAGLVFESANPDSNLIDAIANVADRVTGLRIVIDHLPNATVPREPTSRKQYWSQLRSLSQNPNVFVKLSEIPVRIDGKLVTDPHAYQAGLDEIWNVFGEDRCLYGSDWPNSDHVATYTETFAIVREYISGKGLGAWDKFFWKNSISAYRWRSRTMSQSFSR